MEKDFVMRVKPLQIPKPAQFIVPPRPKIALLDGIPDKPRRRRWDRKDMQLVRFSEAPSTYPVLGNPVQRHQRSSD